MKLNWNNLSKEERREYMQLQMSPSRGSSGGGYLPDDCGECGACGQPCLVDVGWCNEYIEDLVTQIEKLEGAQ